GRVAVGVDGGGAGATGIVDGGGIVAGATISANRFLAILAGIGFIERRTDQITAAGAQRAADQCAQKTIIFRQRAAGHRAADAADHSALFLFIPRKIVAPSEWREGE